VKPHWSGQELGGKTVLLWSEQGFGDFIQFIRYAPLLKRQGAKVFAFVRDELRELAQSLVDVDLVLGPNDGCPPFDYYINLLSIPRVLGTDLSSIPHETPYLFADPDRSAWWSGKFRSDPLLKVGLVWAGSSTHLRDRYRSLKLERLAPVLDVPGVRFFSLQKGAAATALKATKWADRVVDLEPHLMSFADTAAAIANLDLVIAVDTAVAHLAGALGKPVWTLIPKPADWRWLEDRDDTPWYPTMRLLRQRIAGDWDQVIARTKAELERFITKGGIGAQRARAETFTRPGVGPPCSPIVETEARFARVAETRFGIMQYFHDDHIGRSLEYYGEYRLRELEAFHYLVSPAMVVLEVGAGIGAGSLWLAGRVGPAGHLFLYEDDRMFRQALQQNLKANRIQSATVMRRRLRRGMRDVSSSANGVRYADLPESNSPAQPEESIDELRLEKLDWLKVNHADPAFEVIEGAGETLWRLRPALHLHATGEDALRRLATRLRDFGYNCWACETTLYNPANFNNRDIDLFSGKTALALIALPEERNSYPLSGHCQRVQ